jgi:hypothetical protein
MLVAMRTFDDIIPPSRRKDAGPTPAGQSPLPPSREPLRVTPPRARFPYTILIGALIVIVASVGALFYFSTAKVTVTPNSVTVAVQNSFTATQSGGALPFEVITAEKIASQSVKSTGTKNVTTSASGLITIYNTQSKPQTLVATTRFATASGLIYRIRSAVTVPAGSSAGPGSVGARVYADKAGPEYNVEATSFTIPGFAGTPQATAVYAKSSTSMTGGASGPMPVVDPSTEASTKAALTTALAPDLEAAIKAQVPAGYVLLPGAATTSFEALAPTPSATGMVDYKEKGTITAIVFPNAALAKAIATGVPDLSYQGEPLTVASTESLALASSDPISAGATSFAFTLSGTAPLEYTIDSNRIAAAMSGKTRKAAEVALTNYPEVKSAIIVLRPFWRQSFPQDPSQITVEVAPAVR